MSGMRTPPSCQRASTGGAPAPRRPAARTTAADVALTRLIATLVACQVRESHARLSADGATQDRLHSHRGRRVLQRSARGSDPGRGARIRFSMDGGASLRYEPLL